LQVVVVERQLLEILVREFAAIRELHNASTSWTKLEPSQGQSNFHRCFGESQQGLCQTGAALRTKQSCWQEAKIGVRTRRRFDDIK
jgi:hypothetical protein